MTNEVEILEHELESLDNINSIEELHEKYHFTPEDLVGNRKYDKLIVIFLHGTPLPKYYNLIYKRKLLLEKLIDNDYKPNVVKCHNIKISNYDELSAEELAIAIAEELDSIKEYNKNNTGIIFICSCTTPTVSYRAIKHYAKNKVEALIGLNATWEGLPGNHKNSKRLVRYFSQKIYQNYFTIKCFKDLLKGSDFSKKNFEEIKTDVNRPCQIYAIGGFTNTFRYVENNILLKLILGISNTTTKELYESPFHDMVVGAHNLLLLKCDNIRRYVVKNPIIHSEIIKKYILDPFKRNIKVLNIISLGATKKILSRLDMEGTVRNNLDSYVPIKYIIDSHLK